MSGKKDGEELTRDFNISGAGLKESKKVADVEDFEEEEEEEEEELQPNEKVKFSDTKQNEVEEEYELDFNNPDSVNKFTSSKTKESESKQESSGFGGKTTEEVRRDISDAEAKANEIDPETFHDVADFIMTLIDSSLASALKWWSKDSSDSAYSLPAKNKLKLTKQLASILIKYNAKFSIELMFIVGLVIMYIPAFRLAKQRKAEIAEILAKPVPVIRKDNIQKAEEVREKKPVVNREPVTEEIVVENLIKEEPTIIRPKVRQNKRPRKA